MLRCSGTLPISLLFSLLLLTACGDSPSGSGSNTGSDRLDDPTTPFQPSTRTTEPGVAPGDSSRQGGAGTTGTGDSNSPSTPAPSTTGWTCEAVYQAITHCYDTYYDCASACADQSCADVCEQTYTGCYDHELAQGTPEAQTLFKTLLSCEESAYSGCYDQGDVQFKDCADACQNDACVEQCAAAANQTLQSCMYSDCTSHYDACGLPSAASDGSGTEAGAPTSACGALYQCENACNGDQTCGQDCYDSGSDTAQTQWSSLIQCGQTQCNNQVSDAAAYKVCLQQKCPTEYNTCFSSSSGGSGSSTAAAPGTCHAGVLCVKNCYTTATDSNSFFNCVDDCYEQMTPQALTLMDTLVSCTDSKCPSLSGSLDDYLQCQQDVCGAEYNACLDPPSARGGTGQPGSGGTDPAPTGPASACYQIHEAVLFLCAPAFGTCASSCNDDSCVDSCQAEMETCIDQQMAAAPEQAATDFGAVLNCRSTHYQTCYDQADGVYQSCTAGCGATDNACKQDCNEPADAAYESCYTVECATEYQTCGIS